MASVEPIRTSPAAPVPLHAHALDNLQYIRETMERAGSFTAVPGWGGVAMGATALAAAGIASHASSREAWLVCWLIEGVVAGGSFCSRAGLMADAVRRGSHGGRRVFGACGAGDGNLFFGRGGNGAVYARGLVRRMDGSGVRRPARRIRSRDCEEVWRLKAPLWRNPYLL